MSSSLCVGMKAVLPAVQLPGGDLASTGEQLDLRDMEFVALPRLAAPDQALALQITEMWRWRTTRAELVLGHKQVVAHCTHQRPQHLLEGIEQGILTVASLLAVEDGEHVVSRAAGDAVAQQALQECHQGLTFLLWLVLKDLLQEVLPAWGWRLEGAPLGRDGSFEIVVRCAGREFTRVQIQHAIGAGQQPGMGVPLARGDAQVGLGIGEYRLCAFELLEGPGTSDEGAGHGSEPFVALLGADRHL